jgi:hypothetical protein
MIALLVLLLSTTSVASDARCGSESSDLCYHDPLNVIHHQIVTNATDCCQACFSNSRCTFYTAWTDDSSTKLNCNLFKGQPASGNGSNCVSGAPSGDRPKYAKQLCLILSVAPACMFTFAPGNPISSSSFLTRCEPRALDATTIL